MKSDIIVLIVEAMAVYFLVLLAHSLRHRVGLAYFYALIGGITAVMSWVTDAGAKVTIFGITFLVGSTVFYTALLLGVFVVYVFDGPRATRIAITTVAGVSMMVPLIAAVLHVQMQLAGHTDLAYVPLPSLRINAASVVATIADLVFLAMAWEFLGKPTTRATGTTKNVLLLLRAYFTLLGVMWLDVLLFSTGAFAGTPGYTAIMSGTFVSRLVISLFACPFLFSYINWQNRKLGLSIESRPVLAILKEVAEIRQELGLAQQEIERRKRAEAEKEELIRKLEATLARVQRLEGLLPVCSGCKKIRVDSPEASAPDRWMSLEEYVMKETTVRFSHGLCTDCMHRLYPDFADEVIREANADRADRAAGQPPPAGPAAAS